MNPIIRYFGGKSGMSKEILKYFPEKETYDKYIEPFGGSYGIGFHMDYLPTVEVYNDLDKNVYSLFKVLSDEKLFETFKKKCDLAYYSEDLRDEFKEKLKEDIDIVDRAFYYFYVNRTSFNGNGGFTMNITPRRKMAKSISDMLSTVDKLYEFHQRLSRVIIRNVDALELIKRFADDPMALLYCDPPYLHATRGEARYDVEMNDSQHKVFVDICCNAKSKFLISGYDHPLYDKLLENGFEKIHFNVKTTTAEHKPKTKIETLWKNY